MKYEGDINDVKLTSVSSGDTSNSTIISWLSGNEKQKTKLFNAYIQDDSHNPIDDLIDKIFRDTITDDIFRKCMIMLSFYEAIETTTGNSAVIKDPKAIFFALLVNYSAKSKEGRIKSVSALTVAKEISPELNYREYLENGGGEDSKFKNEYKTVKISRNDLSSVVYLELPIIKGFIGTYRFATDDRPAARMFFENDDKEATLTVPANVWMSMVQEAVNSRKSARFSLLDEGKLHEMVKLENRALEDILRLSDMQVIADFPSIYDYEFDDNGKLILINTKEPPELGDEDDDESSNTPLKWVKQGSANRRLSYRGNKFYFVTAGGSMVKIWAR